MAVSRRRKGQGGGDLGFRKN
ncbi:hypothetical protein CCACVL1_28730 [Corchorus capsularis]|uniref:Uncharacterized protein n=1 Tax=Corchorus capsularis TaxID=210143 RepID=A0A1R3G5I4_COCAP|nr:hypothetical protein CCACVL1_28730 [Corchorus capsularis]